MNGRNSGISIGIPSLVTVLTVLLLTCFAVLTLIGANSQETLAVRAADAVTEWYGVDAVAEEKYAAISAICESGGKEELLARASELGITVEGDAVSYNVDMTLQTLHIELLITEDGLARTQWRTVSK